MEGGLPSLGGRQGAVKLSDDESTVYAVNAASNTVSAFRVTCDGLALRDIVSCGGVAPDSVDEHNGRVYVLNSGGTPNVTAFNSRTLETIGSRDLPGALGAAQVSVAPDGPTPTSSPRDLDFSRIGRFLYAVSTTGRVTGYRVCSDGSLEQVISVPAAAGLTGVAAG